MAPAVRAGVPPVSHQPALIRGAIERMARVRAEVSRAAGSRLALTGLPEQPFDAHLLALSSLYRLSRRLYVEGGGEFVPALVSSPRTLGSPILLEQRIEYSPIASELEWAALDRAQRHNPEHLLKLRTYSASLFHEQSHRLLWRMLPPPRGGAALGRYLNFVESLVIVADMALGDELGPALAAPFYLTGVVYDPGTRVREGLSARAYRNYLQAALQATYLNLEQYEPREIPGVVGALFPACGPELSLRASRRSLNLDRGFVTRTNPVWQKRHRAAVLKTLSQLPGKPWAPPSDPVDTRERYLWAERWFDLLEI